MPIRALKDETSEKALNQTVIYSRQNVTSNVVGVTRSCKLRENTEVGKGEMGAIYLRIGLNDESRLVNNSDDFRKGSADHGEN